jgi:hypothetical protein
MTTRVVAIVEKFRQVCQLKEAVRKLGALAENNEQGKLHVAPSAAYFIK